jgi:hypothetical protein
MNFERGTMVLECTVTAHFQDMATHIRSFTIQFEIAVMQPGFNDPVLIALLGFTQ